MKRTGCMTVEDLEFLKTLNYIFPCFKLLDIMCTLSLVHTVTKMSTVTPTISWFLIFLQAEASSESSIFPMPLLEDPTTLQKNSHDSFRMFRNNSSNSKHCVAQFGTDLLCWGNTFTPTKQESSGNAETFAYF